MIETVIHEAQHVLVPDRRTTVFEVQGRIEGDVLVLRGEVHSNELKQRLLEFVKGKVNLTLKDSLSVLPQASLGGKTFAVVSMSVANLRAKPAESAEMVTQAIMGTPLRVLKKEHGWLYVQCPDEYLGWLSDGFAMMNHDEFASWTSLPKVIVTSEFGFTHTMQQDTGGVVSDIVAGSLLALKSDAGGYYEVQYPDGRVAFVSKRDAQPFDQWLAHAEDTPGNIVATARRFIGIPYLWGGTSSKGFDCSGFTKTVYFLNGVQLPRDASQQALVGDPVEAGPALENLKVGDLLFFGSRPSGEKRERVTHVAIYIGDTQFIHASGDVRINSLQVSRPDYSAYRHDSFLRARRIIGATGHTGVHKLSGLPYYGKNEL